MPARAPPSSAVPSTMKPQLRRLLMHRLRASVAAVLVGASFAAAGSAPQQAAQPAFRPPQSQPAAAQPQEPVFRSGVDPCSRRCGSSWTRTAARSWALPRGLQRHGRRQAAPRRVGRVPVACDRFATAPDRTQVPTLNVEDRVMMRANSSNTRSAPGRLVRARRRRGQHDARRRTRGDGSSPAVRPDAGAERPGGARDAPGGRDRRFHCRPRRHPGGPAQGHRRRGQQVTSRT